MTQTQTVLQDDANGAGALPRASLIDNDENTTSRPEQQLVIFKLAEEQYAVDISVVESIIKMQEITLVPHAHDYVEGVTNLRGTVLPVISLAYRFGLERTTATRDTRIVVVETDKIVVGLVVDAVTEVLRVYLDTIEPPSPFVSSVDSSFITGIVKMEDRLVTLLDLNKIFSSNQEEA